ncbi:MAG: GNAT family N-acetyltransferase [Deltaproteobacteria bacterium]|nr:GNAT family N-acetyltransferase [Deltaproteobacteria bacterium]MBI3387964.1 GNAT family N-acetyltransferase [Deltaproteobacteria bacterium]
MSVRCLRYSYVDDPTLYDRVFELLDLAFPGAELPLQSRTARQLGMRWEEVTTPFCLFDGERLLAHVGVLDLPLVLAGREVHVGGIHAVATHPHFRRRGYYRAVMEDALRWADARYQTLQLSTAQPELYEPFGFRVVPEHRFIGAWSHNLGRNRLRVLDYGCADDLALIHTLLRERTPISHRLGVVREYAVFLFNEARRSLYYAADLDLIVSFESEGTTLRLFDLVGRALPPLFEIVERIPLRFQRVETHFTPDRLAAELQPEAHLLNGDDYLMVRGSYPPERQPLMLPRTARC